MSNNIDEVYENVYISDIDTARTYGMNSFDSVVTVCQDSIGDHIPTGVSYHFFNMSDGPKNSYGGRSDYELFQRAAETVLVEIEAGKSVLIHCHMGQSRSVATTIAALGVHTESNYHEVYSNVKSQRPQINPDMLLKEHAIQFIEERTGIDHKPFRNY